MLRAANYPKGTPGRGWWIYEKHDKKIGVVVVLGQSGFNRVHLANPFLFLPDLIDRIRQETDTVIIDFHAATTAEKYALFYYLDGKVSAVIGSHFKVLTADETILPGGTGIITDTGRTGSNNSVVGLLPELEINKFVTQIPERSKETWDSLELQGVLVDINDRGKTTHIERIKETCPTEEKQ
jgi:calcineurin-like phosphoesterase